MGFMVAKILDVADGVQNDQFTVGSRTEATSLDDLDPMFQGTWRPEDPDLDFGLLGPLP